MPDDATLRDLYNARTDHRPQTTVVLRHKERLAVRRARVIKRMLPLGLCGKALEIGCGAGADLELLAREGWEVHGLEPDPQAARIARERGLRVDDGFLDGYDTAERYDLVLLNHVLEHFPDPVGALSQVRRLLKPDGSLYVEVPNIMQQDAVLARNYFIEEHLVWFRQETLEDTLFAAGFKPTQIEAGYSLQMLGAMGQETKPRFAHNYGEVRAALRGPHFKMTVRRSAGMLKRLVALMTWR